MNEIVQNVVAKHTQTTSTPFVSTTSRTLPTRNPHACTLESQRIVRQVHTDTNQCTQHTESSEHVEKLRVPHRAGQAPLGRKMVDYRCRPRKKLNCTSTSQTHSPPRHILKPPPTSTSSSRHERASHCGLPTTFCAQCAPTRPRPVRSRPTARGPRPPTAARATTRQRSRRRN